MKETTDFETIDQLIDAYFAGEQINGMNFDQVRMLVLKDNLLYYPIALDRLSKIVKRSKKGYCYSKTAYNSSVFEGIEDNIISISEVDMDQC